MSGQSGTGAIDDCWNRIGTSGDRSCVRLKEHGHCRNCEVHRATATRMMRREAPTEYRAAWTEHFSAPEHTWRASAEAVLVFRIEREWFALPAQDAVVVAESGKPHRLPHRGGNGLGGIVNVKGRLYPYVLLSPLLRIVRSDESAARHQTGARIVVFRLAGTAFALPVEEVHGIHRYHEGELQAPPATLGVEARRYIRGMLHIDDMTAGCLEAEILGQQLAGMLK